MTTIDVQAVIDRLRASGDEEAVILIEKFRDLPYHIAAAQSQGAKEGTVMMLILISVIIGGSGLWVLLFDG